MAFRYRNFRLFWIGALLSSTGTWVQGVTVPFVILQLTDSAAWVGFAGFAQFLPAVLVGPLAGSLADRFHRRSVLLVTQTLMAADALLLWVMWVAGVRNPWALVGAVALGGVTAGLNIPSWQSFISELVPREVLLNAVTLNSTQFNAARAFGPAVGGLVLGLLGPGPAFLINAISFLAVIVALLMIHVPRLERARADRGVLRQFAQALRYARHMPGILACFLFVLALGALGSPVFQLLAVFADQVFHVGDLAYGFLGAALGIGALLAAPLIAGPGHGLGSFAARDDRDDRLRRGLGPVRARPLVRPGDRRPVVVWRRLPGHRVDAQHHASAASRRGDAGQGDRGLHHVPHPRDTARDAGSGRAR